MQRELAGSDSVRMMPIAVTAAIAGAQKECQLLRRLGQASHVWVTL